MTFLFAKYFFTNSISGASVGSDIKGNPYPTVCVGISPITADPATAEMKAAKTGNRKGEAITSNMCENKRGEQKEK
jgi:hypothetical protein